MKLAVDGKPDNSYNSDTPDGVRQMNAKTIREALKYEARNNLAGMTAANLEAFAYDATDAELIRFAQLINNTVAAEGCLSVPDSTDLARANID